MQSKTKTKDKIEAISDDTRKLQHLDSIKVSILNKYFTSVFTKDNLETLPNIVCSHASLVSASGAILDYIQMAASTKAARVAYFDTLDAASKQRYLDKNCHQRQPGPLST